MHPIISEVTVGQGLADVLSRAKAGRRPLKNKKITPSARIKLRLIADSFVASRLRFSDFRLRANEKDHERGELIEL